MFGGGWPGAGEAPSAPHGGCLGTWNLAARSVTRTSCSSRRGRRRRAPPCRCGRPPARSRRCRPCPSCPATPTREVNLVVRVLRVVEHDDAVAQGPVAHRAVVAEMGRSRPTEVWSTWQPPVPSWCAGSSIYRELDLEDAVLMREGEDARPLELAVLGEHAISPIISWTPGPPSKLPSILFRTVSTSRSAPMSQRDSGGRSRGSGAHRHDGAVLAGAAMMRAAGRDRGGRSRRSRRGRSRQPYPWPSPPPHLRHARR